MGTNIEAGTLRVPGVAGPRRTPVLPNTATISETALPGFDTTVWFGLFAPAGTSKAVVDKVNGKMNAVLGSPDVRKSFDKLGIDPMGGAPDVLADKVKTEI
jgi:tripartite-type tricarboxylate transporter receptor subunit TctC